jgi:plasmid stabilization system protein ParE
VNRSINRFAAEDLAQAVRFYKREAGVGLARRFLAEFERAVGLLEQHPGLGTPNNEGRRTYPLSDFPYSVIYRSEGNSIRILVVRHQSRDPEYGDGRQ